MKVSKLELCNYKRLMLNNIKKITYKPEEIYQLILGTNGSGKSSLLQELSPLPANKSNYNKGGYKLIEIEHSGSFYVLTSDFKTSNKHSFVKNNLELNPGGTASAQKELVEQEFGITQEIHELLIGSVHFTQLSPAKRREWITKLSDVDYSYALGVYKNLRSLARDTQGALKHSNGRITNETNKLLSIGDLSDIEERYEQLHKETTILISERDPKVPLDKNYTGQITSLLKEIESVINKMRSNYPVEIQQNNYKSEQDILEQLEQLKLEREVAKNKKHSLAQEHDNTVKLVEEFGDVDLGDLDQLEHEHVTLKNERYSLTRNLLAWRELKTDPTLALEDIERVMESLIEILKTIPVNAERKFSRENLIKTKENLFKLTTELGKCRNRLAYFENKLEHVESLKDQQCPKCNHKWVPGKSEMELTSFKEGVKENKVKIAELEKLISVDQSFIEQCEQYQHTFFKLKEIMHSCPSLGEFWDSTIRTDLLFENPSSLVDQVFVFHNDVKIWNSIKAIKTRIEQLDKLFSESGNIGHLQSLKANLGTLEVQIEASVKQIIESNQKISKVEEILKRYRVFVERFNHVCLIKKQLENLYELQLAIIKNNDIDLLIRTHQDKLALVQSKRNEKITLEEIIKDLEADKILLEKDLIVYNLLAKELSPHDGLIAEQLTGFIESLVDNVNKIIESVWNYELRVIPCGLESGDLDYKFPLLVRHEGLENTAPDISKGSEAQVEIVNLAFRLVIMGYLNLSEYPIFLDEFSRAFDEQHRLNAMHFIKRLVETGNYTQMFMISHYAGQYNVFANSEILVLDSTNISVPTKHNLHVAIE